MYSEPHRFYHNLVHIDDCLGEFDRVRQLATDPVALELAVWFHDAVYDPRAADNEERSAELAKNWLRDVHASDVLTDSVSRLVLATKNHDASLHADAPLLVDVDLSILGRPSAQFWEYERQIREEYAWVEETVFAVKRAEILHRFLARERIYQTDLFFHRMEAQARANLRASVQRLSDGLSS
jgi:predicted metal-dependent HD superfamily phosphohydrolase